MDVIKLLEYLQEIIESSAKVPVTGKILIDKKEITDVVDEIINSLPDEFRKAEWLVSEKERILGEAMQEAELIKKEQFDVLKRQIENHNIVKEAQVKAQEIINSAQRDAKLMRLGARDYADEILSEVQTEIDTKGKAMVENVQKEVESFVQSLSEEVASTSNTIRGNIKELRDMK